MHPVGRGPGSLGERALEWDIGVYQLPDSPVLVARRLGLFTVSPSQPLQRPRRCTGR